MTRRGVLGLLAGVGTVLLAGCGLLRGDPEMRYRITVVVDDNGTQRIGSSVWSWTLKKPAVALATAYDGRFRGEAVAIELAGGSALFAILRGADGSSGMAELLPERAFGDIGRSARGEETRFSPDRIADLRDIASRTGEVATLDCRAHPDWCPMLVTFADERNPASVARVEPDNLAAAFGPGVALRRLTVEITDDAVTREIEKRFSWWHNFRDRHFDGTSTISEDMISKDMAAHMSSGSFSTEFNK